MIFVTLGSQKFQFNRLLKQLDKIIEDKLLTDEVFAQIGYSDYIPKNYKYKEFVNRDEFKDAMEKSSIVITHGGTGAIITAVKKSKKVIAVPRLAKFGEHVDNHQIQLVKEFEEANIIMPLYDIEKLADALRNIENIQFAKYNSNTLNIINDIEVFIKECGSNE